YEVLGAVSRRAEPDEVAAMQRLAEAGFEQGALGLSSGLDYVPGRFADAAELGALSQVATRYGAPYVTHMRGYEAAAANGISEVRRIAELSGVSPHVSHYHGPANMLTALIDELRADGIDATFDSYPYTSGSSILAMLALPPALQDSGPEGTVRALRDESIRTGLRSEWFEPRADELARVRLSYVDSPEYAWVEGLALPAAAAQAGLTVGELVCDLLVAANLRVGCVFRQPPTNTDDDVRALLRHEAHVAGSDGIFLGSKPHPRGWGTFARFLGVHTRALHDWTWGEASVHLSSHAARRFGLADRGLLRAGYAADVVVVDQTVVSDVATYDDPRRPARGIEHVYVNGVLAYTAGSLVNRASGRGLRRSC
ncbi:MAG: amidohydrolase family protein, partial [Acidothermaceae bacterium]